MKCLNCGCEFEPRHVSQKYCSKQCHFRYNSRKYYERHRERCKAANALSHRMRRQAKRQGRICEYCGKKYDAEHGLQKYCSAQCRNRAYYQRQLKR